MNFLNNLFMALILVSIGLTVYAFKKGLEPKIKIMSAVAIVVFFILFGVTTPEKEPVEIATANTTDLSAEKEQATKDSLAKKEAEIKANEEKAKKEEEKKQKEIAESKEREEKSDITKLAEEPTSEQSLTLNSLARQKFKQEAPYKGSKIHSALGVIQDWTQKDDKWFYKAEVTIVNAFGAERETVAEFTITPTGPDSGNVEMLVYE